MQEDLDADYKLIRDIEASETETWNEITSNEFKTTISNGETTELNLVDFEGTINVVNESGVDVTFTTNTNNDSITIDDTYYDSIWRQVTISYDLATPSNQGFNPVGTWDWRQANSDFTGSFDGQNHTISNLSINRLYDDDVGLFGAIGAGGEVKNVGVINVNMTGADYVGGLAGANYGTVSNSYSTGNVTGESTFIGGLIGENHGDDDEGTVLNSYSTVNVTGESNVGGLIGENHKGTVSNSYSTGNVTGESMVGGLVGSNWDGTVSNSYWDRDSTGQSSSAFLPDSNGLTTSEMQGLSASSNMNTFDFTSTWSTVTGDYPELQE
jgi:hypothetical protein